MSDELVKALINTMTAEQKAELLNKLMDSLTPSNQVSEAHRGKESLKTEEAVSSTPRSNVTEDFRVVKDNNELGKRKTPVRARKNQWVDDGENRDPDFDPAKFEKTKASRNRGKSRKKDVECHVCGKTFSVNPSLVYGEFIRCNRCTGR